MTSLLRFNSGQISKHFGYSVEELARLNRLNSRDRHLLKIGQRVYLPEEKDAPVPDLKLNVKIHSLSGKSSKQVLVRLYGDTDTVETSKRGLLHWAIEGGFRGMMS